MKLYGMMAAYLMENMYRAESEYMYFVYGYSPVREKRAG